jgi:urease accessory protein
MLRALTVQPGDARGAIDFVALDHDARHRRRIAMKTAGGIDFLLDLPKPVALRHGDGLRLDDGRVVEVRAAPESVVDIAADGPAELVRIAWHLGNRHLPTQLLGRRLRIRRDHVIEDLVLRLGGRLLPQEAPFDPEGGAYGAGETQRPEHHHHGHEHHGHDHHDHRHHGRKHDH